MLMIQASDFICVCVKCKILINGVMPYMNDSQYRFELKPLRVAS